MDLALLGGGVAAWVEAAVNSYDAKQIADAIRYAADKVSGYTPGARSSGQIYEMIVALADQLDDGSRRSLVALLRERYK